MLSPLVGAQFSSTVHNRDRDDDGTSRCLFIFILYSGSDSCKSCFSSIFRFSSLNIDPILRTEYYCKNQVHLRYDSTFAIRRCEYLHIVDRHCNCFLVIIIIIIMNKTTRNENCHSRIINSLEKMGFTSYAEYVERTYHYTSLVPQMRADRRKRLNRLRQNVSSFSFSRLKCRRMRTFVICNLNIHFCVTYKLNECMNMISMLCISDECRGITAHMHHKRSQITHDAMNNDDDDNSEMIATHWWQNWHTKFIIIVFANRKKEKLKRSCVCVCVCVACDTGNWDSCFRPMENVRVHQRALYVWIVKGKSVKKERKITTKTHPNCNESVAVNNSCAYLLVIYESSI